MESYPRIMRAVGASDDLIEAFLRHLGLKDRSSMAAAAELLRAVEGQDVHEIYRECRRMVDWYESADGPRALVAHGNGGST